MGNQHGDPREIETMHKKYLLAGFAMAAALPSLAFAQETCEQRAQNRVAGTVVGGVAGALLGSAVAGHNDKATGAVVGGIAGAVVGNQLAKGPADCQHAYGWYDNGGRWHAGNADPQVASGYYDRGGQWVYGRPVDYRPPPQPAVVYAPPPPPQVVYAPAPGGAWDDRYYDDEFRTAPGYPEFHVREDRIRAMIRDAVREDRIERDDARAMLDQLRDIRREEARQYQIYGARLSRGDFERINDRLARLDRRVDDERHHGRGHDRDDRHEREDRHEH
jgi:hypothetical protein